MKRNVFHATVVFTLLTGPESAVLSETEKVKIDKVMVDLER